MVLRKRAPLAWIAAALLAGAAINGAATAGTPPGGLLAGTGKALIDPPPPHLPIRNNNDSPLVAVHDSLYARALVLQQGNSKVVLIVADAIMLPDDFYERAVAKIAAACGVARDHVLLSATHAHTVPWSLDNGYAAVVLDGIMSAVAQAQQQLEPVRIGVGEGRAYINMNRDEMLDGAFILGQDPEGPSDKAVRVVAFFRADGSPAAIFSNYAVHAVSLYSSDTAGAHAAMVSADIPGVANRFVDEHYAARRAQSFWTSGAAGDQNPILMSYHAEPASDGQVRPSDMQAAGFAVTQRLGQALALQIIRVTDRLSPQEVTAPLRAAQSIIECPTKQDAATKQAVRVSYLRVGSVDLLGISGEVTALLDQHLRARLGGADALLTLTLTNGYSGYLPDDAMYARGSTFEVSKTAFAAGCLEKSIIAEAQRLLKPAAH
jgi:hypothetical protein